MAHTKVSLHRQVGAKAGFFSRSGPDAHHLHYGTNLNQPKDAHVFSSPIAIKGI